MAGAGRVGADWENEKENDYENEGQRDAGGGLGTTRATFRFLGGGNRSWR